MNGYFLNMNEINIASYGILDKCLPDIKIILNKYFYNNKGLMDNLMKEISTAIPCDNIEITRSIDTRVSMSLKISKSLKKSLKKEYKKIGYDNACISHFYNVLQNPIHEFLLSIHDSFREVIEIEFANREVPAEYPGQILEGFFFLIQHQFSSNILLHIISLLDRDNYLIIEFL